MSVFKDYFFKTLRWPLIHRAGPLAALVEGLGRALDEVREDIIWLRNQFNPWTCDPDMVAAHAASRGLVRHPNETEDDFHKRCIKAFAWHRLGGGQLGMPAILEDLGYPGVEFINLRTENPERWAEFRPRIPVSDGLDADDYALVSWVVNETKPARSKMANLETLSTVSGFRYSGGTTVTVVKSRLLPDRPDSLTIPGAVYVGGYVHSVIRVKL